MPLNENEQHLVIRFNESEQHLNTSILPDNLTSTILQHRFHQRCGNAREHAEEKCFQKHSDGLFLLFVFAIDEYQENDDRQDGGTDKRKRHKVFL